MTAIGQEYAWVFFVAVAGIALYALAWSILRESDSTRARGYPRNSPEARILRGEL
ncbi:hypothetical protein NY08_511 [Rhodococcus sp. B7740]|uniref:hypothetical protein n=1 Tax=Rhodococcus sp. B7740 TaxID=1564114 RepID=UPI0005D7898F|nr:hypothetical protein [Rhodococcus sp. B7740]AJW38543.1 hypothetical protein NY08_511 [Rhodococcus sp. B7740]